MVRFDYQLTQEEFNSASKLFQTTKLGYSAGYVRYVTWAGGGLFVVFVIAIVYKIITGTASGSFFWELVVFPVILIAVRVNTALAYKRRYGSAPSLGSPHTIEADDTTLRIITPESDGRMKWEVLVRWAENEQVFILVQQGGMIFYPMSKRNVAAATVDSFRQMLERHVSVHARQGVAAVPPPPPPMMGQA